MVRVRFVLQVKWGKSDEVAQVMSEAMAAMAQDFDVSNVHILTDLSGSFHRVVEELDVESIGVWEQNRGKIFSHPAFTKSMARIDGLLESGYAEFFTIVS